MCPWHFRNVFTFAHSVSRVHIADLHEILGGVWIYLCLGTHSFPGWVVFSLPLSEVSLLPSFPLGTQLIALPRTTMYTDVSWAESSLPIHTCVMMHRVCDGNMHRQSHIGQLATWRIVIHLLAFSQQKKSFFVWLCKSVVGWLTYSSWWCCWLVSWLQVIQSSWWLCWPLDVHVHLPYAPHWVPEFGCHGCYLSLWRRGSCTGAHGSSGQTIPRLSAWC